MELSPGLTIAGTDGGWRVQRVLFTHDLTAAEKRRHCTRPEEIVSGRRNDGAIRAVIFIIAAIFPRVWAENVPESTPQWLLRRRNLIAEVLIEGWRGLPCSGTWNMRF